MKVFDINWMLRFKNKPVLTALIAAVVAFVYQVLGIVGVAPGISENEIINIAGLLINLLVAMGIVIDPTTAGTNDTTQAKGYTEPRVE